MRKKLRFHGLKRSKVRQSWNKYNFYNLSTTRPQYIGDNTFFQQKWTAKSSTRAYHGEQVREKQWQRMFRSRIASVVPMRFEYLARYDGSEQAAGRGSGADSKTKRKAVPRTPYMNMVYAPIERRLDTAIFRALFASSTRQARQFVVHGAVKVNGKKMIYPGYLLNPGDMFQVDPERVLYGTGAPKDKYERHDGRRLRRQANKKAGTASEESENTKTSSLDDDDDEETPPELDEESAKEAAGQAAVEESPSQKKRLSTLLARARELLESSKSGKAIVPKQKLRSFQREVRRAMSRGKLTTTTNVNDLDAQMNEILSRLSPSPTTTPSTDTAQPEVSPEEQKALKGALKELQENPIDPTKPYATPWRPRDYMSAFAFIPRYLEVNQNICSAVYLRHPVARPGLAEVPSPFGADTYQLAFTWYLRRR